MPIESAPSPTAAPPIILGVPPEIERVESGWNAELGSPKLRIIPSFSTKSAPIVEEFVLGPGEVEFTVTQTLPVDTVFKVWRITGSSTIPGDLITPLLSGGRIFRVASTFVTLGGILKVGSGITEEIFKIVQQKVISVGVVEVMIVETASFGHSVGEPVTIFSGTDISPFTFLTDPDIGDFQVNRTMAGIPLADSIDLFVVYRETGATLGAWSVYFIPSTDIDPILTRSTLPPSALLHPGEGPEAVPFLELTLPPNLDPAVWHGAHIAVGVAQFLSDADSEARESVITWIPVTTLVAPPALSVLQIGFDHVQLGIEHPVGEHKVGATVIRFPGSGSLADDGENLNKVPVASGVFTDGPLEPFRLTPGDPENGPPYPTVGEVLSYTAVENVDTPWPVTALRKIQRKEIDSVPFTLFQNAGQQEEIHVDERFVLIPLP